MIEIEYPKSLALTHNIYCPECMERYRVRHPLGKILLNHPFNSMFSCSSVRTKWEWDDTAYILTRPRGDGTPLIVVPLFTNCPELNCSRYLNNCDIQELRVKYTHILIGEGRYTPAIKHHVRYIPLALFTVWI